MEVAPTSVLNTEDASQSTGPPPSSNPKKKKNKKKKEEESVDVGAGQPFCVVRSLRTQILTNGGSYLLFSRIKARERESKKHKHEAKRNGDCRDNHWCGLPKFKLQVRDKYFQSDAEVA